MSDSLSFGPWLRRLRQTRGLTQDTLADQVGCATQTIRKIEAGARRPSYQMAGRLADVLKIQARERDEWMLAARQQDHGEDATADDPPRVVERRSLPSYFTAFVGRSREQGELLQMIGMAGHRLITLVGPGGIGKTRLAIEAANGVASFADGVVFVSLAPIASAAEMVPTIIDSLGLVRAGPGDPFPQLLRHLRDMHLLLILDNLEHLLGGGDGIHWLLGQILAHAPNVTILATSRERLGISGEWALEISGLSVPPANSAPDMSASPALSLFFDHMRRIRPEAQPTEADRRAVAEICRMLGGLPLAIELAAAWVTTLSCAEIAAEIRRGLDFLALSARDLAPRHQSMRVVFEHSWQLLTQPERSVLAKVALFRGGFTREAATFVSRMRLTQLAGLVQKSLVRRSGPVRYDVHEVIRHFAAEKLAGEATAPQTRQRFSDYYLALSAEAAAIFADHGDRRGLDELVPEIDNLRAAMQLAIDDRRGEQAARISTSLRVLWLLQSLYQEGINWAEQLLLVPGLSDAARGDQLNSISYLARAAGMLERARSAAEEAIVAHRRSQDQEGLAWALGNLAQILLTFGDYRSARALHTESTSIRRMISGPHTVAWGLIMQVIAELLLADRTAAHADYTEALALSRANADRFTEGGAHNYYALGMTLLGDASVVPIAAQALELLSAPNYPWGATIALEVLAAQAGMRGQHQQAGWFVGAARQVRQQHQIAGSAIYRVDYDRLLEMARGTLDERAWSAAIQHGLGLPREELVRLAQELAAGVLDEGRMSAGGL